MATSAHGFKTHQLSLHFALQIVIIGCASMLQCECVCVCEDVGVNAKQGAEMKLLRALTATMNGLAGFPRLLLGILLSSKLLLCLDDTVTVPCACRVQTVSG